jgi:hypothetical protein
VLFLFVRPDWGVWSHWLKISAYIFLFSLGGSGALLAILMRVGIVRMIYSDNDKQSMPYRMSKAVAEMEQSQQRGFSDGYYENLGVKPPKRGDSDGKPTA